MPSAFARTPQQGDSRYIPLLYSSAASDVAGLYKAKTFDLVGRYLYVAEITGPMPLYVRVGSSQDPAIRIAEGMVLEVPSQQVTVFCATDTSKTTVNDAAIGGTTTSCIMYASGVPLARIPERDYGVKAGFWVGSNLSCSATAGLLVPLFSDLVPGLTAARFCPTFGKRGGTLWIANEDATAVLRLVWAKNNNRYATNGTTATLGGFPIYPKQTLILQLSQQMALAVGGSVSTYEGLCVASDTVSSKYSYMVSANEADVTDDGMSVLAQIGLG